MMVVAFLLSALGAFALGSFSQASLHLLLGHRRIGGPLYTNHVTCHHALYSRGVMTTPRYLDEEKTNTPFYLVVVFGTVLLGYRLLRWELFLGCALGMTVAYFVQVYVHVQYHLVSSPLQRFHWFLRLQRLHAVHHQDMRKNHSILFPLWDRLFGTYAPAEPLAAEPRSPPKGWRSALLSGNLPDLQGDKLAFAVRCEREFDGIVQLRLWNQPFFMVSDPALIQEVLITKHRNFTKPMPLKSLDAVFGNGLLTSEYDLWHHDRRILQPAFHRERLASCAATIEQCAARAVDGWADGSTQDLYREMGTLCLDVFARTLLGEVLDAEKEVLLECAAALQDCNRQFTCLPKERLPFPSTRRLWRAVKGVDEVVYGLIAKRRQAPREGNDLLSALLRAQGEGDAVLTDKQVRDELVTMFMGGHETIAAGICWALFLLASHPEAALRVEEEVDRALQGRAPGMEDLGRLPFTANVIKETLRLYPPAYQIGRVTIDACELGGYRIPAKAHVLMYQWAVHRSPRYFERAEDFWPDRWTPEMLKALPKFAYFPFGGGPRTCIGASFATVETTIVLATIAQRCRLALAPGAHVVPDPAVTLPLQGNTLPMVVRRREAERRARAS